MKVKKSDWKKESVSSWNNRACSWSERSVELWEEGNRKYIPSFIEKHIPKRGRFLDIGCGDGYGSYKMKQLGYNVIGMDFSSEMIDQAKKSSRQKDIPFLEGDVSQLSFEKETFSGIMSINVLEWTEIPAQGVRELWRILEKDGLLAIGILGPTAGPRMNNYPSVYGKKVLMNGMMPWELEQLSKEVGFVLVDEYGVYKKEVEEKLLEGLSKELRQSLTFMWVFMLRKVGEKDGR